MAIPVVEGVAEAYRREEVAKTTRKFEMITTCSVTLFY